MSCSKITNEYDGITHDYTHKHGLVWRQIYLPPNAPREWQDRAALWNAVELAEQSKDSRLARELIVALPNELTPETNIGILEDFIMDECVSKGMCGDVCYHDTDGNNPHAHIMMTVRPLDKNGKWQAKTQKEYLLIRNGEEKAFTASECKAAERNGWEKQYLYRIDENTKVYLPPSRADGLERVNRYPKATKYGRQNPVYEQWNSEEQLLRFREAWAKYVNRILDLDGVAERIDHRSYKAQGINKMPTVHEGVSTKKMAVRGIITVRRKLNDLIRESNRLSDILVELAETLLKLVGELILKVADGLESLRVDMLCLSYKQREIGRELASCTSTVERQKRDIPKYRELEKQLAEKQKEQESVEKSLKSTLKIFKSKRTELEGKLYGLSEEINEIRSEMSYLENWITLNGKTVADAERKTAEYEDHITELQPKYDECKDSLKAKATEYRKLKADNGDLDQTKLTKAREHLRPTKDEQAVNRIERECGRYDEDDFYDAEVEVAKLVEEKVPEPPVREDPEEARRRQIDEILSQRQKEREERRQKKYKSRDDAR